MTRNNTNIHFKSRQFGGLSCWHTLVVLFLLAVLFPVAGSGQTSKAFAAPGFLYYGPEDTTDASDTRDTSITTDENEPYFDVVLITMNVLRIGSFEIEALIYGDVAYLPVNGLFDYLKIKNIASEHLDSVSGFFINPKSTYLIDKTKNQVVYEGKAIKLKETDLIRTETALYMKSDYFGEIFGLDCSFNFRSLSVALTTKAELPAIREMQQEAMRQNMNKFKGEKKADTVIGRRFSLFNLGVLDWSVQASQEIKGRNQSRINLGIGAMLAGGELNAYVNYDSELGFDSKQQYFRWRYVNNNHPILRQVTAGRISAQSTASLFAPVTGVQFTNTPTVNRKSFGTYTLGNTTEPGWTVELYMNDVMINYTKADASGFYTFEVPMVYGNTQVKLRFYGPWGEEKTEEQYISIPFNFVPEHQLEYTLSAGVVDDQRKSKYSRAAFNYGLSKRITIGGGTEYLSSVTSEKSMPFINASLRVGSRLLLSGEHTYGVRSKLMMNYRLPSNLRIDIDYARYNKEQKAVWFNYHEEKKLAVSMPLRGKKFNAFSRLTINQFTTYGSEPSKARNNYTTGEFLISGSFKNVGSNFTTNVALTNSSNPWVYSNLSFNFRLPKGLRITPQTQFDFSKKRFSSLRAEAEKRMFKNGFANLTYERNIVYKNTSVGIGFRYNFSFTQTSFYARKSKASTTFLQTARGSLLYDGKTNYLGVNNNTNVGRGGLIVKSFLDLNCNGKRELGEPDAFGLKLHVNGGKIERNDKDTTIRVTGLEAYNDYYLEIDKNSFENISWQIRKSVVKVTVEPNKFKLIEVPVAVVGEVSGTVSLNGEEGLKGLGRIIVNIYNNESILVAKTLTEGDGFFSYIGLAPGAYTASVDAGQLVKIKMIPSSENFSFTIKQGIDGDVVDGLEFVLHNVPAN